MDRSDREPDRQDEPELSGEQREKLLSLMQKMMEIGICAVYGQEAEGRPDATVDCEANAGSCKAICCSFRFALTREEVRKGHVKHDSSRPFFIATNADGYCAHLDRGTLRCSVWPERPLRCRRYDCREDSRFQEQRDRSQE